MSKAKTNMIKRIVDAAMTVLLLCLMAYQVTGEMAHEWIGICMTVTVITHQILNRKWYSAIFKGKYNPYRTVTTVLNILLLISFALMGMNAPDLYTCKLRGEDVLHYYRTKTRTRRDDKAEMFVTIDKKVESLIKEYFAPEGSETAFDFCNRYKNYILFGENVNECLKKYSDRIGRTDKNDRITLYWARHSWATIAYSCGVDKGVINDGLCHVDRDMKITDIYIKKNWKIIWDGNAKVMKKFKWK